MSVSFKNKLGLTVAFALVIALQLCSLHNGFFWDTVHFASAQPDFFFSNNFSDLLLPNRIDSGHIPGFAMYIAGVWKIFGRSIIVSHLAMLPFAAGIVWQLWLLCRKFIPSQYAGLALLLLLIDPSLLCQLTMVSPDVLLIFFFLLAVNSILQDWKIFLSISIFFLFAMSMRGMMLSFCLLVFDLYLHIDFRKKPGAIFLALLRKSLVYIPAVILFTVYFSWHYALKGWVGFHEDSPWAKGFEPVDAKGFLYNIGLFIWRLLDFGRFAVWMVFVLLLVLYRRNIFRSKDSKTAFVLLVLLLVLLPPNLLWVKNLVGHRYLIPVYLIVALLAARILFSDFVNEKLRFALVPIWFAVLLSGNFWVYPVTVSEGWDATLAHQPYYGLRHQAIDYLETQNIPLEEVQTFFPNYWSLDQIELNGDKHAFGHFDGTGTYVFFSNVFNPDDVTLATLANDYVELKRFEKRGIFVVIYQKRLAATTP